MIKRIDNRCFWNGSALVSEEVAVKSGLIKDGAGKQGTIAHSILSAHNLSTEKGRLSLRFDALASHDITYVGIIQTAKASGLTEFPVPYVLTNCHNSLCAVGGTINEDDHVFGLSAAKKYGGIFVPPHQAVIHTYMREMMAKCGGMILGSDSHTRYGALGTMAIGEGGPELVKQILKKTYDVATPDVIAVHLTGKVPHGVGPQDVALALIGEVFKSGFVKNKVLEFIGDGIDALSVEFRNGIDVMTTETTCLSSIWQTDDKVAEYYAVHGRAGDYKRLTPAIGAEYDGAVEIDLGSVKPMIALPFHPSNVFALDDVIAHPYEILSECENEGRKKFGNAFSLTDKIENGKVRVQQGVIAGCAGGTFDNILHASRILKDKYIGADEFTLSVYPSSQPTFLALNEQGSVSDLVRSGAVVKTAFCGPCFGAGDVPANGAISIRHTTRNFENREGSKPGEGQIASVCLMDARSIAATAANGGYLASAANVDFDESLPTPTFDGTVYQKRVYMGFGKAETTSALKYGPNIADWPTIAPLPENLVLELASVINDPVTTTDELIPSGETSSYRSNPLRLAEFTLSRKRPDYVARAKAIFKKELDRRAGKPTNIDEIAANCGASEYGLASAIFAVKPGDGSAREQAASCQRVLGAGANIAREYATKRYRSNLINWGMIPFISADEFLPGDVIVLKGIRTAIAENKTEFDAKLVRGAEIKDIVLKVDPLTETERKIILDGCLMNYYANNNK